MNHLVYDMTTLNRKFHATADLAAAKVKKSLATALRAEMRQNNESIQSLARRLGTGRTSVRRILDKENTSITLGSMSRAAAAVGLEVVLTTRKLSPAQLGRLAAKLPAADKEQAAALEEKIVEGFYGKKARA